MMTNSHDALTRRSALGLMSAAGVACLGVAAQPAAADPADPPPSPTKYIFGYGSLIHCESRTRTVPKVFAAWPVIVKGIQRGLVLPGRRRELEPDLPRRGKPRKALSPTA